MRFKNSPPAWVCDLGGLISGKLWSGEAEAETGEVAPLPLQDILSEAWSHSFSCGSDMIVTYVL